ncbi:hypothetical protein Bxe_C0252 [Paraburkholderia xenovorans LB400]|uniref:Uncharacterized protein n=1 Tax=Paraburkholderia xenovorans (strain LB400) TaxID=266265 RepID=Q13IB3_PARXL|nr:hypothetical protein Bxe_C0252 [Paraburkholderia xenovorans LB400]
MAMPDARLRQREHRQHLIESAPGERALLQPRVPPALDPQHRTARTTFITGSTSTRNVPCASIVTVGAGPHQPVPRGATLLVDRLERPCEAVFVFGYGAFSETE